MAEELNSSLRVLRSGSGTLDLDCLLGKRNMAWLFGHAASLTVSLRVIQGKKPPIHPDRTCLHRRGWCCCLWLHLVQSKTFQDVTMKNPLLHECRYEYLSCQMSVPWTCDYKLRLMVLLPCSWRAQVALYFEERIWKPWLFLCIQNQHRLQWKEREGERNSKGNTFFKFKKREIVTFNTNIPKNGCFQQLPINNNFTIAMKLYTIENSLFVSGKLPTYPSPKPTLTLTFHLRQNVGLGER